MVKQIIKEAMEHNPLGLKEAVDAELRNRIALALEAKMEEMSGLEEAEQIDELDKKTLSSYVKKSEKDSKRLDKAMSMSRKPSSRGGENIGVLYGKKQNRETGIERAKERLAKESVDLDEAKMTDAEVLSAAKALAANGKDAKTKSFGQGLVDFYKKEGSFTPAQVGGLQNIMKNASFQMAKESADLSEVDMGQARSVQDRRDSAKSGSGNKYHVVNKNGNVVSSHDNQGDAMRASMKNDDYRVKRVQ